MSEILTGHAEGGSRSELVSHAKELAEAYYGGKCVEVKLGTAQGTMYRTELTGTITTFSADFLAREKHRMSKPSFGFPRCQECDRTSDNVAPVAAWADA